MVGLCILGVAIIASLSAAEARDTSDPVHVAVIANSDSSRCFSPGVTAAIKHFTRQKAAELNRQGGMAGRQIITQYYDHYRDPKILQEQID